MSTLHPLAPRVIALCGFPKSGKSEIQRILHELYGFDARDDSEPLRRAACELYGLSWEQVTTQEGKSSMVEVAGTTKMVRDLLGSLGSAIESLHGTTFLAEKAMAELDLSSGPNGPVPGVTFGSVRLDQPFVYARAGGLVCEVTRPGTFPAGPHDWYDRTPVHVTVSNTGDISDLAKAVRQRLDPFLLEGRALPRRSPQPSSARPASPVQARSDLLPTRPLPSAALSR